MKYDLLCRYGEISLKGQNRGFFEKRLVENIKDCLKKNKIEYSKVERNSSRIIISGIGKNWKTLKNIFGITSLSYCTSTSLNLADITKVSLYFSKKINKKNSFKVDARRANKNFKLKSPELNALIGEKIQKKTGAKVDLSNPDHTIGIEILDRAYIFEETIAGYGGLPIGTEGKVACLMEDDNSLLAAWLMMKRGVIIIPLMLKNLNTELIEKFVYGFKLKKLRIDSSNTQELKDIMIKNKCKALIVGQNIDTYKNIKVDFDILRPLIGYSKMEIDTQLKTIIKSQ